MDALELLRTDHDTVRALFTSFRKAKEAGDTRQMAEVQRRIFRELDVHTAIEEEVFYPAAEEAGEEAEELVKEGAEEHHVVDVLMGEIRELDVSEDSYAAKMTVLIENVEHHAEEEEDELFPKLREVFGDDKLAELGDQLEAAKQRHELEVKSKHELYEQARARGIEGRSDMTKDELAEALGRKLAEEH